MPAETTIVNLDYLTAKYAQAALEGVREDNATDMDSVATNALGVLLEMGIYSCFLYLYSRRETRHKPHAKALREQMLELLGEMQLPELEGASLPDSDDSQAVLNFTTEHITADLERVLLVRQVYEQMLLYVRYGAAALKPAQPGGNAT